MVQFVQKNFEEGRRRTRTLTLTLSVKGKTNIQTFKTSLEAILIVMNLVIIPFVLTISVLDIFPVSFTMCYMQFKQGDVHKAFRILRSLEY